LRVDSSSGRITIPALNPKSKPLGIPYRRAFRIADDNLTCQPRLLPLAADLATIGACI
jgi:hypothetical protein